MFKELFGREIQRGKMKHLFITRIFLVAWLGMFFGCNSDEKTLPDLQSGKISIYDTNALKKLDVTQFYGKSVEQFLNIIQESYIDYSFIDEPPSILQGCVFTYPNNVNQLKNNTVNDSTMYSNNISIFILFDSVRWQKRKMTPAPLDSLGYYDIHKHWNINLCKKEMIWQIGIHINNRPVDMKFFGPRNTKKNKDNR